MSKYFERLKIIRKKYLDYFEKDGVILDIGCGGGQMMKLFQEEGFQVQGVDTDDDELKKCERENLAVFHQDAISFMREREDCFSGIFCSHLIEHIPAAAIDSFLECCIRSLRKSGVLIILTPNILHLGAMANFWNDPTHIKPYTKAGLEKLLTRAGLTIRELGYDIDTKVEIQKGLISLPIDLVRVLLGLIIYGRAGRYTELFAVAQKR